MKLKVIKMCEVLKPQLHLNYWKELKCQLKVDQLISSCK